MAYGSHKFSIAQWYSIQTSNQEAIGLTPVGRAWIFFFRVGQCVTD